MEVSPVSLAPAASLTKTGAGVWAVTGANTYGGGTTVSAGRSGSTTRPVSGTGTGNVIVQSGGTLAGVGFISGNITVNPTAIWPRAQPGTLTGGTAAR